MAQARQLNIPFDDISPVPRTVPGHWSRRHRAGSRQVPGTHRVILAAVVIPVVLAAVAAAASSASAQTCLRPKWTECVQFPNGGRHTGVSPQGTAVQTEVSSGPEICVGNEEEIGAQTYAQFWRNGVPWPDRDWEVNAETFCFYKN
jgi:hypothetical protein